MHTHLKLATALTRLLDNQFTVGNFKFGLDPILGIVPGFGDFFSLCISFYLIWIGKNMQLPQEKINQMISNIVLDFIIGIIPFIGDIGDFIFKSNSRNLAILQEFAVNESIEEGKLIG